MILKNISEMLKGVLEGCILQIVSQGDVYGYEIAARLRKLGFKDVVEGTVYAVLLRLEKNNLVTTTRRASDLGPPRKFYNLNENGKKELIDFWKRWNYVSSTINKIKEA